MIYLILFIAKINATCTEYQAGSEESPEDCTKCSTTNENFCETCRGDSANSIIYVSNEEGICVEKVQCTSPIDGCISCVAAGDKCAICDIANHFVKKEGTGGETSNDLVCECDADYKLTGTDTKTCVPKICTDIDTNCATCVKGENDVDTAVCDTCKNNFVFESEESKVCIPKPGSECLSDPLCTECVEEKGTDCKTCKFDTLYQPTKVGETIVCTVKEGVTCKTIDATCKTCDVDGDGTKALDCLECTDSDHYAPAANADGFKVCTLKPGVTCKTIDDKCETCEEDGVGTSVLNCLKCIDSTLYEPKLTDGFKVCTVIAGKECLVTDTNCAECEANGEGTSTSNCKTCKDPSRYEVKANSEGKKVCTLKETSTDACTAVATGGTGGQCKECNTDKTLCTTCWDSDNYEPDTNGGCKKIQKPAEPGSCSPYLTGCSKCREDDNTYCTDCIEGYGLRGGYCSECQKGLYYKTTDGKPVCLEDCSAIPHCLLQSPEDGYYYHPDSSKCAMENGVLLCFSCDWENGYDTSDDHKSCVYTFNCNEIEGCLSCNGTQCIDCDESKNFEKIDGRCSCDGIVVNGVCQKITDCDSTKVENCETCYGDSVCYECRKGYGLSDGKCSLCEFDKENYGRYPCPAACSVANCNYCSGRDPGFCESCKAPYKPYYDGKCVDATPIDCPKVIGCSKCAKGLPNVCIECNDELNFKFSRKYDGTCVCKRDFDFINNQCVRPIGPYIPEEVNTTDMNKINNEQLLKSEPDNDGKREYTVTKESLGEAPIEGKSNLLDIPSDAKSIIIPSNNADLASKEYMILIPDGRKLKVDVPPNTVTTIDCKAGTELTIPSENEIDILGGGKLTLSPIKTDDKTINLNQVKIQNGNDLTLDSTAKIVLKELDILGQKECTGQTGDSKTEVTVCKVESGGVFTPHNIDFKQINIGLQSILNVENNKIGLKDTLFKVFYNRTQLDNQIPIKFVKDNFPDLSGAKVQIKKIAEKVALPTEDENFTIAEFPFTNGNEDSEKAAKDACEKLSYQPGQSDANLPDGNCYKVGDEYRLVARRVEDNGKKKKKLSGGAIAGIVIACVVVVAAIIALLVYFLVIKKKNQSTTSTQGDSSIAI